MAEHAWYVESLRATFFPAIAPKLDPRAWWVQVAGHSDDNLVVNEGPAGHASAFAPVDDGKALLQLLCTPERIDWGYSIGMGSAESGTLIPALETPAIEGTNEFLIRVGRWISSAPTCRRLAFGAAYRAPVASKEEGYDILRDYLHTVEIDPATSSDLLYRINRPRKSKAAHFSLTMNRVAQWNVVTFQGQQANPQATLASVQMPFKSHHYRRIELDCNTAADNTELIENTQILDIVSELSDLALEIVRKGDVR